MLKKHDKYWSIFKKIQIKKISEFKMLFFYLPQQTNNKLITMSWRKKSTILLYVQLDLLGVGVVQRQALIQALGGAGYTCRRGPKPGLEKYFRLSVICRILYALASCSKNHDGVQIRPSFVFLLLVYAIEDGQIQKNRGTEFI